MNERLSLVFLPCLMGDRALWARQQQALHELLPIGHVDFSKHASIGEMAAAVLASAPPRFIACGLSLGGYVAHEIMHIAPERVAGLALFNTSARPDSPQQTENRMILLEKIKTQPLSAITEMALDVLVHPRRRNDQTLCRAIIEMADRIGAQGFIRQENAIIGRRDSRPNLSRITCPTLIVAGREDAITPVAVHEEMARGISGSQLVVIEDCGHMSSMERPEQVNLILKNWLEELLG